MIVRYINVHLLLLLLFAVKKLASYTNIFTSVKTLWK